LRAAVSLLGEDERTGGLIDQLGHRIRQDSQGNVALRSADQVVGYTDGLTERQPRSWREPVLKEVQRCMNPTLVEPNPIWDNYMIDAPDLPSVRQTRRSWQPLVAKARADGVDFNLLDRSIAEMRSAARQGQAAGVAAVGSMTSEQTYDDLFTK
jgi:hypothetical protein